MPPREKLREMERLIVPRHVPGPQPIMADFYTRRVIGDLFRMRRNPPEGCHTEVVDGDIRHWLATVLGPSDTPYDGGQFRLDIRFPGRYPLRAPLVKFVTKVYHCNVSQAGDISLDILGEQWAPSQQIWHLFVTIRSLLAQPNPDKSVDSAITDLYVNDRPEYERKAREWTALYAQPGPEASPS
ncbi:ubiquitin-conjugating enzyme E2 4-like [Drosophila obscura]|uniref:ubiquitin-conjugating enzyme E2 4-like n=1 Tax=Drosophila obscura TaxID=7282 RepID=UPI001BB22288|nr:ubiquitin-conjugating enzyme E2 4-like [Drosophila obscura]